MATLTQKRDELVVKQTRLHNIFAEAGDSLDLTLVKSLDGDAHAKAAEIKRLNTELTELGKEVDDLATIEKVAADMKGLGRREDPKPSAPAQAKSLGQLFVESAAYKGYAGGGIGPVHEARGFDAKTLFQTSAGWAPETTRTGKVLFSAQNEPVVADLIPKTTTNETAVVYMEETTFTNAAAERSEAGAYAESAFALTERTSTVRMIGHFLPVSDEQLRDVARIQDYINNRMTLGLNLRLDTQLVTGDGNAPNLSGLLTAVTQTQAKGADPVPDAVYKGIVKCRVTGKARPNAVLFHPNDWQDIRLLRTADGVYLWGSPADPGPERIWGLGVVQSTDMAENTALVGDFSYTELAMRQGIEFQITNSHDTYFINGKQAIRCGFRAAFIVYRAAAFCEVTGI